LLVRSDRVHENRVFTAIRDWTTRVAASFAAIRRSGGALNRIGDAFFRRSKFFLMLDAYVLRGFLFYFALVLTTFVALYVVVTLFNLLPDIVRNQVPAAVVAKYFSWLLPYVVYTVAPLSVLLGILIELGTLTKTNEILAVKAGGVSLYRLSLPLMAVGMVCSGAIYAMQDFVLPYSNQRQNEYRDIIKGRAPQTYRDPQSKWMMGSNDRMYHYSHFEPDRNEFGGVTIFQFEPDSFDLREWAFARSGSWNKSGWTLRDGWVRRRGAGRDLLTYRPFATMNYTGIDTPDYFKTELRSAQEMTYGELKRQVEDMTKSGFDVRRISVDLYRKVSFPLASFIMALIGIPFSFSTGKKGAFHGIGLSIVLGILYWATFELFNKLGGINSLSPVVAAWFPNLIFGCGGIWLMLRLKT
jgi:LPS export ABC transporter permease LptG